ncbi:MAG TPA: hypothetical protein VFL86_21875 [Burkholderiaceae bacterium]|nr:hypothetical protein [Burkholderiaceae bacterium]
MKIQDIHTGCGAGSAPSWRVAHSQSQPGAAGPTLAHTSRASSDLGPRRSRSDTADCPARPHPIERASTLPNLDARYGPARPARVKPGRSSGVQPQELERDGRSVRLHPELLHFPQAALRAGTSKLTEQQAARIQQSLRSGQKWKYQVSDEGAVALAPDRVKEQLPTGDEIEVKLGHVTLVGGTPEPKGRLGGEMRFGPLKENGEPVFFINNDSGRFSEYGDRYPAHLEAVAEDLKILGLPEPQLQWIDMIERGLGGKAEKQAQMHATAVASAGSGPAAPVPP